MKQINLLPAPPRRPWLSAPAAALSLLACSLLPGWQAWDGQRQIEAAQRLAGDRERELAAQQQLLLALQKKLGDSEATHDIGARIAALEPQTRVSKDLLERLKAGELGSLDGYGAQLAEFAALPQRGVWVTRVTISNAGRALRVEGRALRKEQILPYAAVLNAAMEKYGIVLTHVEVAPMQQSADSADDTASVTPVWTFKLF